ncbi:PREDICTED: cation/H(+) antiporter 3-like [Ipomoea nil]|uniref:cation/H(+) antiporter 3-like n=1 Tax=Ipomoea nil TaxID=35883 RepID=UPI00090087FB|nr:PREDICTED: cation/H(+) antiporter 3-like [Ipomoea nil]
MATHGAQPPPLLQNPGSTEDYCMGRMLVHSPGIWAVNTATNHFRFFAYSLPRMLGQLAVMFLLAELLHLLLKRFRLPRFVSELLTGIILGPTGVGRLEFTRKVLVMDQADFYMGLLSKIGFLFFIFLSGVKMDLGLISRSGVKAWTIGVIAVAIPHFIFICFSEVGITEYPQIHRYRWSAIRAILRIQSQFSFPVIALLVVDLKVMNSELGRLSLATALVSDLLGTIVMAIYVNVKMGSMTAMTVVTVQAFVSGVVCVALIVFTARPLSAMIIKRTPEGRPVDKAYIILMAFLVFFASLLSDNAGMSFQYGPFILGLAVHGGPPLGSTLVDKLDTIVSGLFGPLMVTFAGMKVNLCEIYDMEFIGYVWLAMLICYFIKYLSVITPAIACKVPITDAISLAFILCTQGVVQMSFYLNNTVNQTFDEETFSMLVMAILIIASVTHFAVASMYDYSRTYSGYQKRDIQHNSANSELRLLTVAHRLEDVLAARKLFEVSCPYRESPLSIYSMFLVELVGRATPLLVDHQLGQRNASSNSRSQKMMDILRSFELQYLGYVYVQFFTSVSLPKFMHYDICSLGFDKQTSMIILPFHKKWNQQGKLIQDSNSIRTMNNNVLETAPCSVGILIDRHKIKNPQRMSSPVQHVAVIFLGGADDREALSYARRMSRSPSVYLTLVRFVPLDPDLYNDQWDAVLDAEVLKDMRIQAKHQDNILYREERVNEGAETALVVRDMQEVFDLILVGRRHTDDMPQLFGLSEWNEIAELGPIGDMLAVDTTLPVSVVVVQQQDTKTK